MSRHHPAGPVLLKIWRGGAFRVLEFRREELLAVERDPGRRGGSG